ncbi:MAG TPA: hypothetical protein VKF42_09615, partial [Chitinivibrionales bacterium]|nr:hypothetical protein [Chitinivibrionales bacterium]
MAVPPSGARLANYSVLHYPDKSPFSAHQIVSAAAVAILTAALFAGSSAQSSDEPIITPFGQTGLKYTESAKTLGAGRLVISAFGDMSLDASEIDHVNVNSDKRNWGLTPTSTQFSLMPALGFGITNFLDFSAALPLYIDRVSKYDSLPPLRLASYGGLQGGMGDLEMRLKLQVPPRKGPRVLDMAYLLGASFPTGNKTQGFFPRHTYYLLKDSTQITPSGDTAQAISEYYSSGAVETEGKIILTFNCWEHGAVIPLQLHLNLGTRLIFARGFDEVILFDAAAEYRPAPWFSLYAELSAEPRLENISKNFAIGNDPLRISPGFTIHLPEGMFISLGGDWGLSSHDPITYEKDGAFTAARLQPDWMVSVAVGWTGFLYKVEPGKKVAKGGDSDNDGIPDSIDKCPMVPEDWDGFEDQDGCPDYDNDKDGIADSVDECPDDPEDYDGFRDKDGCPDPDNDGDGICDPWVADQHREDQYAKICTGVDKCPNLPEDFDGFEDQDGCPDYDNDLDGVPDSLDRCPNEPGPADNQGCPKPVEVPKVKEIKHGRLILKGVEFKGASADLTPESFQKLDDVFESLKAYPGTKIEVCGYTDNTGNPAANR